MDENLIHRLESAVTRLEAISSTGFHPATSPSDGSDAALDPSIVAYGDLIDQFVGRVSSAAEIIGGQVLEVTNRVKEAFSVQKELLIKLKTTQKPDPAGLSAFLKPLNEVITKAAALTEGRRSDFFNHLKAAVDSLSALAWIAFTGKGCGMSMPVAHVEESWQMAEFYSNKVLVEYRNKDPNHVEWVKALKELYIPGLRDYVKSFHALGPVWSQTGKVIAPSKANASVAPSAPPPPPASLFSNESSQASSSKPKVGMSAVFQEIGTRDVTAGLRKVTDDMKTKNRTDRSGVVGSSVKQSQASARAVPKVGPPKLELQMGRKWVVENQIEQKSLIIEDCDSKQSVYVYGCKNSVLQIQGKVNNITIDNCKKTGVVFKDVVAAFEIVNSNGVEVQCQVPLHRLPLIFRFTTISGGGGTVYCLANVIIDEGSAPTISVDNTSGCQIYLSKDSLETSISSAKSSEINVLVPNTESDGDWVEHSLPQQYIHIFKEGRFETTPASHSGG